jgi:hypothetical protein
VGRLGDGSQLAVPIAGDGLMSFRGGRLIRLINVSAMSCFDCLNPRWIALAAKSG